MKWSNASIILGSVFGFLGVAMGAFGAHAVAHRLTASGLAAYQTAAHYQLVHALALVAAGLWSRQLAGPRARMARLSGWAFSVGILFFSGSLYALALTGVRSLGMLTPVGGLAFLVGWACLAASARK